MAQLLEGLALLRLSVAALGLFLIAGACWLPVLKLQVMLRDEAERAPSTAALPAHFHMIFKWWVALGIPAFCAVLAIYWLMVAKPLTMG